MNASPRNRSAGQDPALLAVAAAAVLVGPPAVLAWAAAQLAALASHGAGVPLPAGKLPAVLFALPKHLSNPAAAYPADVQPLLPGAWGMYGAAAAVLLAAAAAGWAGWRCWRRVGARRPGYAASSEIASQLSLSAARRRTAHTRSREANRKAAPQQVALSLGRATPSGQPLWGSAEDSYLYLGPPRSGKGVHLVIPQTVDAPGAVLVSATRPDTFHVTHAARREPVMAFDPQQLLGPTVARLRWSPIRGCADPLVAITRAGGLTKGAKLEKEHDGAHWDAMTSSVIRGYLYAAAIDSRPTRDLLTWSTRPGDPTPARILRHHPQGNPAWADELVQQARAEARTRDSVFGGVRRAFDALADPRVLQTCSPPDAEAFDPAGFLDQAGTLYLLGDTKSQLSVAPLIAALIEDLLAVAHRQAADRPSGRLDPPLTLMLDEAANIAPIPTLPNQLADGGGSGITTIAVLQSLAQARRKWNADGAAEMLDSATIKVIFGGLSEADDLRAISSLAGEVDEPVATRSRSQDGIAISTTVRRVPALPIDRIRGIPEGRALVLGRRAAPVEAVLTPYWKRGRRRRGRWRRRASR
jgi:type IV secretory pathway TraG/TraD family ATPase VirD4